MPRVLVLGLCAGYFLVLLDATVLDVVLPQINSDLQAGQSGMAGVVNAYTIVLAALLLPSASRRGGRGVSLRLCRSLR